VIKLIQKKFTDPIPDVIVEITKEHPIPSGKRAKKLGTWKTFEVPSLRKFFTNSFTRELCFGIIASQAVA
jgi:hypothetical protein